MFNANKYYVGFSDLERTNLSKSRFYLVDYFYKGKFLYFIQDAPNSDKELHLTYENMEKFFKKYRKRSMVQLKKAHSCKHEKTHLFLQEGFHSPYAQLNYHFCYECGSVDIREVIHDKEKHEAVINLKFASGNLNETRQEIKELKEEIKRLEKEEVSHYQEVKKFNEILQS